MSSAKPKAVLLYGQVPPGAASDEQDVLVEAATVRQALIELGYDPVEMPITLDLSRAGRGLRRLAPAFVFNLVESLAGKDRLAHLAPALLDELGLSYTGSRTEAIFFTLNKLLTKQRLKEAGIATPEWVPVLGTGLAEPAFPPPYIVKSVWEHASIGMTASAVAQDGQSLAEELRRRSAASQPGSLYVEAYIEGREFNLALLAEGTGSAGSAVGAAGTGSAGSAGGAGSAASPVQVLPPAEILFRGFPEGKPRIVDYAAKWDSDSEEYRQTQRSFDFPPADQELLERLQRTALACWRLFDLGGYARVDFRVDTAGRPWVLEVNTNPCLSPDAGFMAAAGRAGLDSTAVVRRILEARSA